MACQDIQVTLSPVPGAKLKAVTTDYRQEHLEGGAVRIYVGDMFFEDAKDLLVEVEAEANPHFPPNSDRQILLDITVRYEQPSLCPAPFHSFSSSSSSSV